MRRAGLVFALTAFAFACAAPSVQPTPSPTPTSGGTLRVGYVGDPTEFPQFAFADPGLETRAELLSCCLARTLLTYPGLPTVDGGAVLQPDLAESMPEIADDSKSWTFRIRQGVHYSPPYEQVEVTTAHIVAAVERNLRHLPFLAEPGFPFAIVEGAADFAVGEAAAIRGLETPDRYTLVVRLTAPSGSLNLVADVVWAPIPPAVLADHGGEPGPLGRHWASTGPYMHETYPVPVAQQSIALVRNPSWDRASDPRRGAWVDRIEIGLTADGIDPFAALDAGQFDFHSVFTPGDVLDRYQADPQLAARARATPVERIWWLPMNLAVPPFDDVAVRRAVNAVINRAAVTDLVVAARADFGPQSKPFAPGHVFPDSLTQGLLVGYDPFASRGQAGDLARARTEMSASRYDSDGDGLCDASVCAGIVMPAQDPALGAAIREDLARIGLGIEVSEWSDENDMAQVSRRIPLQANVFLWGFSLSGDDLTDLLRGGPDFAPDGFSLNASLVGATADDLAEWGYTVTDVPSLDDVIDRCRIETGHLRARCYAELDQLVSEIVVPWVPLFSFEAGFVSSPRVANFAVDQSTQYPALDGVTLQPGQ